MGQEVRAPDSLAPPSDCLCFLVLKPKAELAGGDGGGLGSAYLGVPHPEASLMAVEVAETSV